jgi:hypothetical protein
VYANDDPVNAVDPSGKDAVSCTAAIIGAISGGFIASWGLAPLIFAAWAAGPAGILAAVILFLAGVGFNWSLIVAAVYSFCQ